MNLSFFFLFIHREAQVYTYDFSGKATSKKCPNFSLILQFPVYTSLKKPLNSFSKCNSHAQVKMGLSMAMKRPVNDPKWQCGPPERGYLKIMPMYMPRML